MMFMAEAMFVYSPLSSFIPKAERSSKVMWHWIGMLCGLVCGVAGVSVIWYNKELHGKPHATSWHGTLGYITMAYYCIETLGGVFVKYPSLVKSYVRPADLKLYHATAALVLFTLACVTIDLAMFSDWFVSNVTGTSWYMCFACPSILALAVMSQITTAFAHRINPQKNKVPPRKTKS